MIKNFTDNDFNLVISAISKILGEEIGKTLASKPVAKLIVSIVYLSGSEDPDRYAIQNLLTFYAGTIATDIFGHRPSDDKDPLHRLATFHVSKKADKKVVKHGLNLLQLIMFHNYVKDQTNDKANGKYNPVNFNKLDVYNRINSLTRVVSEPTPVSTAFLKVITPQAVATGLWS